MQTDTLTAPVHIGAAAAEGHQISAEACTVQTVGDIAAFVALEGAWNDTVERAGIPHPFVRHEWVRAWWEAFGAGRQLHILIVRSGGRILAIAPLLIEDVRMYRIPVRRIAFMANDHTPRMDVIVAEREEECYRALWNALQQTRWDVALLHQLPADSPTRDAFARLAKTSGCGTVMWRADSSPYLPLHGTWDSYFNSLDAKFRSNVRNRLSRLQKLGDVRLEVLRGSAALEACGDAVRLEASGWKAVEGTALDCDPAVKMFYANFAERAVERDWFRLLFLTVNGTRIATAYSLRYEDRLFLCKTGYDPDYAKGSPFKVLNYFAIQHAFDSGLTEFDLLGDAEPWKLEWMSASRPHDWMFIFSNTVKAGLVRRLKAEVIPAWKRWRA